MATVNYQQLGVCMGGFVFSKRDFNIISMNLNFEFLFNFHSSGSRIVISHYSTIPGCPRTVTLRKMCALLTD